MKNLTYIIAVILISLAPVALVAEEIEDSTETVKPIRLFKYTHQDEIYQDEVYQDEVYQKEQENFYKRFLDGKAKY